MQFYDYSFIYLLLPITLVLYYLLPKQLKNTVLLIASVCFYIWTGIGNFVLVTGFLLFNYYMAVNIEKRGKQGPAGRRTLRRALGADLLIYVVFLYFGSCTQLLHQLSGGRVGAVSFAAPLGMGFILLSMISFLVDVANGTARAPKGILHFLLYGLLFIRIPAGPIVPYHKMQRQINEREEVLSKLGKGSIIFIVGLAKCAILGKSFYELFQLLKQLEGKDTMGMWLCCFAFGFAAYYGFSGLSDMARGLGWLFGFELPENFHYPFCQLSISGFWKNWHISFGNWVREYLILPLGIEQLNTAGRAFLVLVLWIFFGAWHGPGVHFLVWGVYFAVLMGLERSALGRLAEKLPVVMRRIGLFVLISAGWVWFFSAGIEEAIRYFLHMFGVGSSMGFGTQTFYYLISHWGLWIAGIVGATPIAHRIVQRLFYNEEEPKTMYCIILYLGLFLISMVFLIG